MAEAGGLLKEGQGHSCPSNALGEALPLSLALRGNWSSCVCHRSAVKLRHHFSPLNLMVPTQKRGASSPGISGDRCCEGRLLSQELLLLYLTPIMPSLI